MNVPVHIINTWIVGSAVFHILRPLLILITASVNISGIGHEDLLLAPDIVDSSSVELLEHILSKGCLLGCVDPSMKLGRAADWKEYSFLGIISAPW
jgi:hypothetical protein